MKDKFYEFLGSDKIKFIDNYNSIDHDDRDLLENIEPCDYLSTAFNWDNTIEGTDYWNKIDEKWEIYLRSCKTDQYNQVKYKIGQVVAYEGGEMFGIVTSIQIRINKDGTNISYYVNNDGEDVVGEGEIVGVFDKVDVNG